MPLVLAAGVADIVLVFALLLMAWAVVWIFQKPIAELFSRIPVVGGQAAGVIIQVTNDISAQALDWAHKAADPLVQLVAVPINGLASWIGMQTAAYEDLVGVLGQLAKQAAGNVGNLAARVAAVLVQLSHLAALVATARANIGALTAQAARIISIVVPDAIATARAYLLARITAAESYLEGIIAKGDATLRAWATGAIAAAIRPLVALIDAIRPWVLQAVAVAVRPVLGQLDQLGRAIDQGLAGVRARLGQLEGLLPLLALLPLIGTLVQVVPRWLSKERDCWDPACSFLGPVTDGLGAAGELLTGSVLAALVIAAIEDPEGTAGVVHGFEGELRPLASLVTEALAGRSL